MIDLEKELAIAKQDLENEIAAVRDCPDARAMLDRYETLREAWEVVGCLEYLLAGGSTCQD